jgi:DNA-directed RNA polymerase beta' subunit
MIYRQGYGSIRITIMDPDKINTISHGEVINADTLNARTLLPTKGGLFSQKIFGPIEPGVCECNMGYCTQIIQMFNGRLKVLLPTNLMPFFSSP